MDSVEDKLMRKAQLLSRMSFFQEWLRFHAEEEETSYKSMEDMVSKKLATF